MSILSQGKTRPQIKHGHSPKHGKLSPTYQSWSAMKQRCLNPNSADYFRYGGRGIQICDSWREFEAFLRDMGERPEGATLDRVDVNGNYEPGNCRWATCKQQGRNRRDNRLLAYNGKTQTLTEWAEEIGISRTSLTSRLSQGWSLERCLEESKRRRSKSGTLGDHPILLAIMETLKESPPALTCGQISERAGIAPYLVSTYLLRLKRFGKVEKIPGKLWRLKNEP